MTSSTDFSGKGCSLGDNVEAAVLDRYARGAKQAESGLCCPSLKYEPKYLELLPKEIIEKDYGCGDPTPHVNEGEVVVDLGSGAGKVCYMLAQKVAEHGRVIGVDFNDAMLSLARTYQDEMARKLGYRNVEFRKARIQDMALDLEKAAAWLTRTPIQGIEQLSEFEAYCQQLRREQPAIPDATVDVIVSNCVLNLVRPEDKKRLFDEMHRVLRRGGRAVISDVVCDEDPTPKILKDPDLWSGCIAGAFREDRFLEMFEEAGFYGVEILNRQAEPWQVIDGIEFRSMTVRAFKGKDGPCLERNQAVIYTGPWKQVHDDDGHELKRGQRMAVCEKTYRIMTNPSGPYAGQIAGVEPLEEIPPDQAAAFDCKRSMARHPRETKGLDYHETRDSGGSECCGDSSCC
jgi:arsenite methyltransferase